MRVHLFEFEDQQWLPSAIRKGITDYLRYVFQAIGFYQPASALICEEMNKIGEKKIIELCSGGGGPIEYIQQDISSLKGENASVVMTDKYPNLQTFELIKNRSRSTIDFLSTSVDATDVPTHIRGFRVMFTAFHHFTPDTAQRILQNAANANAGIGIFDVGDKNFFTLFGNLIINPLAILLFTPFFRPFSWSKIFYTYVLPFIPLCAMWDGVVSVFRLYSEQEAQQIIDRINAPHYKWKVGKVKNKVGMRVFYLIGVPA